MKRWLFLACPFGSFERIDFLSLLDHQLHMRRARAVAGHPLAFRIRVYLAEFAGFILENLIAFAAFVDDCDTAAAYETAAFFAHESAFRSLFNCFTKHFVKTPLSSCQWCNFLSDDAEKDSKSECIHRRQ
jgi:hypothetical protein